AKKTHRTLQDYFHPIAFIDHIRKISASLLDHPLVQRVLHKSGTLPDDLYEKLNKILTGETVLNKGASSDQADIARAIQRALIYLSYPTGSSGSYGLDGDWGAGSNRGYALFLREHAEEHLKDASEAVLDDSKLIYAATYINAAQKTKEFANIPVKKDGFEALLNAIIDETKAENIYRKKEVYAIENLNQIDKKVFLSVKKIIENFRTEIQAAADYGTSIGYAVKPQWIAALARTETAGLPRPKYEHHWLYNHYSGTMAGGVKQGIKLSNFQECRFRSTSFGMGQLMGVEYKRLKDDSGNKLPNARAMYYLDVKTQFRVIVDFLKSKSGYTGVVLGLDCPDYDDYDEDEPTKAWKENSLHKCVYAYNGAAYLTNNYHINLSTYFKEAKDNW
ncbi:DUF3380 domain-containing protein, partial [bacterium]|nr:DUF3380 domain-containing protein [bacterium]